MNDDVERMFRLLVLTMTSRSPEALTRPFQVGDLYQDILPYRLYRRELGLDTNQDYETTLLALLSGAGGYLDVEERMADTLRRELESPNPDSGVFRQFATAEVSINPEALAGVAQGEDLTYGEGGGSGGSAAGGDRPGSRQATGGSASPRAPDHDGGTSGAISAVPAAGGAAMSPTGRPSMVAAQGETCRFCGGTLPAGRPITFCPHCGQDHTVLHCEACGTELEVGWKYCTTCGRGVAAG